MLDQRDLSKASGSESVYINVFITMCKFAITSTMNMYIGLWVGRGIPGLDPCAKLIYMEMYTVTRACSL